MFGISTTEFLLILAVGLIVFGPKKLPDLARTLGRVVGEFKKASAELKRSLDTDENLAEVKRTFDQAVAEGMTAGLAQKTPEEAAEVDALAQTNKPRADESEAKTPATVEAAEAGPEAEKEQSAADGAAEIPPPQRHDQS